MVRGAGGGGNSLPTDAAELTPVDQQGPARTPDTAPYTSKQLFEVLVSERSMHKYLQRQQQV